MQDFYAALPAVLQRMTRWVFAMAATVVVIGPVARHFVIQALHVPVQRVAIVINGVPEAALPRRKPQPDGPQRLLFLGNLSERKGLSILLQALRKPGFDRTRLQVVIAGGGDVAGYQAKARALGIDEFVKFEGWCDQEKSARLLAASDMLVLPSYEEVLPLVVLEALANGVAVVCTPVGEIPSLLTDGVDARFVTPGDVDDLAAVLQEVLREPALIEAMGHNGRMLYEQHFSLPRFFSSVAHIHQRAFGVAAQQRDWSAPTEEHVL
jgi:glycosyltransferase involved in cell wall biosynthesis